MKTKDKVLEILERNRGESMSGAEIAKTLGLSRNSIWKAIEELRREGVEIFAQTNKGYYISPSEASLSAEGIKALMGQNAFRLDVRKSVTSTNDVLKQIAHTGEAEGYVLVAEEQTKGKGRLGRQFYSPANTGIYMSILLRPKMNVEDSLFITTSAAVAVARAIETVSLGKVKAQIKWVNDIYVDNKKVCGILTEASISFESGQLEYAVLGIGVNICPPEEDFPDEIKQVATSVFHENGQKNIRNRLTAEILKELAYQLNNYTWVEYLEEYRQRSMLIGKNIFCINGEKKTPCTVLGIDDKARLLVRYENGDEDAISTGEVSVRLT